MSEEQNRALIERIISEFNKDNLEIIDECMAESFIRHAVGWPDMDRKTYKQLLTRIGMGSPLASYHGTIDEIVCQGKNVAFRCTHRLIHAIPILGVAPTGKQLILMEAYFSRIENGRVSEWWALADMLGFQQQLGLIPAPK